MKHKPLSAYEPWIAAANVRGRLDPERTQIVPGRGSVGDLVLGVVEPAPGIEHVMLDSDREFHQLDGSRHVIAVLGPRDSSTHVCATLPPEGLEVHDGARAHWVAGESGIVGCLERAPAPSSVHKPENAMPFRCAGLLADFDGVINIRRFAVNPQTARLSMPAILVAATSSEAGKTVLSGELIKRLAAAGKRVAAIKATGTGGVLDSLHHARNGAIATFDQVDAGLITTHCSPDDFLARIPSVLRQAQETGADLLLVELGGDLVSANNPTLFELPELMQNAMLLLVIANDALSACGVASVNASRLNFPTERIRYLSSPFRNYAGLTRRMATVGIAPVWDPRSPMHLDSLADEIVRSLPASPARPEVGESVRASEQAR